ncbi:MAG: 30S ribosomal protein S9 [Planctomycetes bacterium]|nr:30S ribosomal protein S9 [Planctomycetota bacterium]
MADAQEKPGRKKQSAPTGGESKPAPAAETQPAQPAAAEPKPVQSAAETRPAQAAEAKSAQPAATESKPVQAAAETKPAQPAESPAAPQAAQPQPPQEVHSRTAPPLPEGVRFIWAVGRRKKAVARIRIKPGSGKILVNKREMEKYFLHERDRNAVLEPLSAAQMLKSYDVWANVNGGGYTGQAGAVTMGLARALCKAAPEVEADLRSRGLLTRDARMKERKKYGQRGARRRFQFSKR